MKRAKFVAPARRELLLEVAYYNSREPGLGARFATAVEEATARASPSHLPVLQVVNELARASCIAGVEMSWLHKSV